MKTVLASTLVVVGALVFGLVANSEAQVAQPGPLPTVVPTPPPAVGGPVSGPRIQFATPSYDFGKVQGGQAVKYDYIFTNTGNQTLEVKEVRPSCGCTTTGAWQRQVEPGQTGSIPIQFNSGSYSGPIHKTISVTCNTPNQPVTVLELKGIVWKPVEVTPTYVYFSLTADTPTNDSRSVRIINNDTNVGLNLTQAESSNPAFGAELKTIRPEKEFELVVSLKGPLSPGTLQGTINVKTSSTNLPVVSITAVAMVQQVMMASPTQLILPSGPLVSGTRLGVTIRNNSPGNVTVSEPSFNLQGVGAQLQEVQVGRVYNVLITFPPGFEVPAGQKAELSVKTSHPQYPLVKVPLVQMPRPTPIPQPPPAAVSTPPPVVISPPVAITNRPQSVIPPRPAITNQVQAMAPRRVPFTNLVRRVPPPPPPLPQLESK
jgi:hypothetical protein